MKVLVPVDEFEFARAQADFLLSHIWPEGTTFLVTHVEKPSTLDSMSLSLDTVGPVRKAASVQAQSVVSMVAEELSMMRPDLEIEKEILRGRRIGDSIVQKAEEWGANMIVLASHGRNGMGRTLLGSVSDEVLRNSSCQVVVIGAPKRKQQPVQESTVATTTAAGGAEVAF